MYHRSSTTMGRRLVSLFLAFLLLFGSFDIPNGSYSLAEETQEAGIVAQAPETNSSAGEESTPASSNGDNSGGGIMPEAIPYGEPIPTSAIEKSESPKNNESSTEPLGVVQKNRTKNKARHTFYFYAQGSLIPSLTRRLQDGDVLEMPSGKAVEREGYEFVGWASAGGINALFGSPISVHSNAQFRLYAKYKKLASENAVGEENSSPDTATEEALAEDVEIIDEAAEALALEQVSEDESFVAESEEENADANEAEEPGAENANTGETQVDNSGAENVEDSSKEDISAEQGEETAETSEESADEPVELEEDFQEEEVDTADALGDYSHVYTFHVDGNVVNTQTILNGETLVQPASPQKDGLRFIGWYTDSTGGASFGNFGPIEVTSSSEIHLYARFEQIHYVFFVDQFGRVVHTEEGDANSSISTSVANLSVSLKENEKLAGWYSSTSYSDRVEQVSFAAAETYLYAKVIAGYWLSFMSQGGSAIDASFYLEGEETVAPSAPTKAGYSFDGWYLDAAATDAFAFGSSLEKNTALYANWKAESARYQILYWVQNPDGSYAVSNVVEAAAEAGSIVNLERNQLEISKAAIADKELAKYVEYANHDADVEIAGDNSTKINVYYDLMSFTYQFDLRQAGKTMRIGGRTYTSEGPNYSFSVQYGSYIGDKWPGANNFAEGDDFASWSSYGLSTALSTRDRVGSGMLPKNPGANNRTITWSANYKAGDSLYVHYMGESLKEGGGDSKPNSYYIGGKVYVRLDSQTINIKDQDSVSAKQIAGFTSSGAPGSVLWKDEEGNLHKFFFYKRVEYTISYSNEGQMFEETALYGEALSAERFNKSPLRPVHIPESFAFVGWYSSPVVGSGTKFEFAGNTMPAHNVSLYAHWQAPEILVNIHAGLAGTAHEVISFSHAYNTAIPAEKFQEALKALVLEEGYTFVGWTSPALLGKAFNQDSLLVESVDIYPILQNLNEYHITYIVAPGIGSVEDGNTYAAGSYAVVLAPAGVEAPEGHQFLHWEVLGADTKTALPGSTLLVEGDMTLRAVYEGIEAPLHVEYVYNFAGNKQSYVVDNYAHNDIHTVLSPSAAGFATPENHKFLGWNTNPNGSGAWYEVGSAYRVVKEEGLSNTLYAQWAMPIKVRVANNTFVYDGEEKVPFIRFFGLPEGYVGEAATDVRPVDVTEEPVVVNPIDIVVRSASGEDVTNRMLITKEAGSVVINKRKVIFRSASAEKEYDGTALEADEVEVLGDGFVDGQGANFSVTGSQTEIGSSKNTFNYELDENTNPKNYEITQELGELSVLNPEENVVVYIYGSQAEITYDGGSHTLFGYDVAGITLNGKPTNLFSVSDIALKDGIVASVTAKDAGSYSMGLSADSFQSKNHKFPDVVFIVKDGTLTINKRNVVLTSGNASKVYDGEPVTRHYVHVSGDGWAENDEVRYSYTGSQTELGESPNYFTYRLKYNVNPNNYNVFRVEGTLRVRPEEEADLVAKENAEELAKVSVDKVLGREGVFFNRGRGQLQVTITANSARYTYDGNPKSVSGYSISSNYADYNTALVTTNPPITAIGATGTDAGTYPVSLSGLQIVNGDPAYPNPQVILVDGSLTINRVNGMKVKIKGNEDTVTFNNSEQSVSGFTVVSFSDPNYSAGAVVLKPNVTAVAKGKNVGVYTMGLTSTSFNNTNDNYENIIYEVEDGKITVTKRDVTLTSASDTKEYDGTPLVKPLVDITSGSFAPGDGFSANTTGTITNVGQTPNTFNYTLNAGTLARNYNITKVLGTLTVTPPAANRVKITVAGKKHTVKYNGRQQSINGFDVVSIKIDGNDTNLIRPSEVILTNGVNGVASGTNVGTYQMGLLPANFALNNPNFSGADFTVVQGELEITKRTVILVSGTATKVYDGTPLTRPDVTIEGDGFVGDEGVIITNTTSLLNVHNNLQNTFSYTLKPNTLPGNYDISENYGTLTVTPIPTVTVKIKGNVVTAMYDGQQHVTSGYTASSSNSLFDVGLHLVYNGPSQVSRDNVGTSYLGLDKSHFTTNNTNFSRMIVVIERDGEVTVTKRPIIITSATDSKTYDGMPLTNDTLTIGGEGYAPGESFDIDVTGTITNVGRVPNNFTIADGSAERSNYDITVNIGTLTVTHAQAVVTIVGNNLTAVYDGTEKEARGYVATADVPFYDVTNDMAFSHIAVAKRTNAGKTMMGLKAEHFENLNSNFSRVIFQITDGFVEITPLPNITVDIIGNREEFTYDGNRYTVRGYRIIPSNPFLAERDIYYIGTPSVSATNAGTYPMGLDATKFRNNNPNFTNVTFNVVSDGELKINPRRITVHITGHAKVVDFDGEEHIQNRYTYYVTDENGQYHRYTHLDFYANTAFGIRGTNVGDYPMIILPSYFTNRNSNYDVTFNIIDNGLLRIVPAKIVVKIVGNYRNDLIYDAKEHTVTGYTATTNNKYFKINTNLIFHKPKAEVKRTDAGTSMMGLTLADFDHNLHGDIGGNVESITLEVVDGYITISPLYTEITVRGVRRSYRYTGKPQFSRGYEYWVDNELYNAEKSFRYTGKASVARRSFGKSYMKLKQELFTNSDSNFDVEVVDLVDGYVEITPVEAQITYVNMVGSMDLSSLLADRNKVDSLENVIKNNWMLPLQKIQKILIDGKMDPQTGEERNFVVAGSLLNYFTNGDSKQENVSGKELINFLNAAGIHLLTLPDTEKLAVDDSIYKETVDYLNESNIANNAYGDAATLDVGDNFRMAVFAVNGNTFTEEHALQIAKLKDAGRNLIVAEVHWDEAALKAELDAGAAESAQKRHVKIRKQEMAYKLIDAGVNVVLGYNTADVEPMETYKKGLIFYGLGDLFNSKTKEPQPGGTWDALIVQLEVMNYDDGLTTLPSYRIIPISLSSSKDYNDFQPYAFEEGSEGFWRIRKKLNGTWGK